MGEYLMFARVLILNKKYAIINLQVRPYGSQKDVEIIEISAVDQTMD